MKDYAVVVETTRGRPHSSTGVAPAASRDPTPTSSSVPWLCAAGCRSSRPTTTLPRSPRCSRCTFTPGGS